MSDPDPPPLAPAKASLSYLLAGAALWALAFAALLSPTPGGVRPDRYAASTTSLPPCLARASLAARR